MLSKSDLKNRIYRTKVKEVTLDDKVDKIDGMGLSSNDFTDSDKEKLDGIETGAQVNAVTSVNGRIGDVTIEGFTIDDLDKKVDKVPGKELSSNDYTDEEKEKLAGIEPGAQVNAVTSVNGYIGTVVLTKSDVGLSEVDNTADSTKNVAYAVEAGNADTLDAQHGIYYLDRINHTGEQAISTVTGLQDALDGKLGVFDKAADSDLLDGNDSTYFQDAATAINTGNISDQSVLSASVLTTARLISLSGDVTGSVSFDGSSDVTITATVLDDSHNHIISNIDGLQDALDGKVDKVPGYGLSQEDYTTDEKTKLAGIEDGAQVNVPTNLSVNALSDSVEVLSSTGSSATINAATATDAGVLSSTDKTKLDGVEAGAQVNTVDSVAGRTGDVVLTKTDVGLGNVDNTADAVKNVLSATKLTTARTLTLSGDTSGSFSFDGSANVAVEITVLDDSHNHVISNVDGLQTSLDNKADLVGGKVPESQLPAFSDVIEVYANLASFPAIGVSNVIYVADDTERTYRWTGSSYVEISPTIALGETSSTAYRGDRGKLAYDHSLLTSGNPHGVTKSDVGLGNVDNTSDLNKPISTATSNALALKVDVVAGYGLSKNDFTDALLSKLNGIESGATVNSSDAYLLSRSNHTGTQAISTVDGLQTYLDGKLAITGTAADSDKLDAQHGTYYLDRANHTGTQAISTVSGLSTNLDTLNAKIHTNLYRIDLSSADTDKFYPVLLDGKVSDHNGYTYEISIEKGDQSGSAAYNSHHIKGIVRGAGWSDLPHFYDLHHVYYSTAERSILGIYRSTQVFTGVAIYLRGGDIYDIHTTAPICSFNGGDIVYNANITFGIKYVDFTDVSTASTNIALMFNGITSNIGRHISGSGTVAGTLAVGSAISEGGTSLASKYAPIAHNHARVESLGNLSAETGRNAHSYGVYTYNVVNASLGDSTPSASYYSVISFGKNSTGGQVQIGASWTNSGNELWFRSLRDITDNWYPWKKIWHEGNDGAGSGLNADLLDGVQSDVNPTASTVPVRNTSGDIYARLFRSTYANGVSINSTAAICMRNNDTTDTVIRPILPAGFITWFNAQSNTNAKKASGLSFVVSPSAPTVNDQTVITFQT